MFPSWIIEDGFSENDELWNGVTAETDAGEAVRPKKVMDEVFLQLEMTEESNLFVIETSHSGEIGSLLSVLGHRTFSLNTSAVIPVLSRPRRLIRMLLRLVRPGQSVRIVPLHRLLR